MRSRLEAAAAAYLDAHGWTWAYEPRCFASPEGQYLPDFRLGDRTPVATYVEVKPASVLRSWSSLADVMQSMEIIWASEPAARLNVWIAETNRANRLATQAVFVSEAGGPWEAQLHVDWPFFTVPTAWRRKSRGRREPA
jgi:hypothetical protein